MDSLNWYQNNYMVVFIFMVVGVMLPIAALTIGKFLRPKTRKSEPRNTTYESGIKPFQDSRVQFNVHYYMFALMFVIFSVETIFLFPWAVAYHRLGAFALIEMATFTILLVIGLIYAWKKKVLKWN